MTVIALKTVDEIVFFCRPPLQHGGVVPIVRTAVGITVNITYVVGCCCGGT